MIVRDVVNQNSAGCDTAAKKREVKFDLGKHQIPYLFFEDSNLYWSQFKWTEWKVKIIASAAENDGV